MLNSVERNRSYNMWERDQIKEAINFRKTDGELYVEPTTQTRLLIEELYGISLNAQLQLENYLDTLNQIVNINFPLILDVMPLSTSFSKKSYNACVCSTAAVCSRPSATFCR